MKSTLIALPAAALSLAACASEPRPTFERGWIGGQFVDVARRYESDVTDRHHGAVVGMPESAPGDRGALVTAAYGDSPIARAGLVTGDLVLSIDGAPVDGGLALRERVEALPAGASTQIDFWRDGAVHEAPVVVGRETYESAGTLTIALAFGLSLDVWPFDDGIDLFHLVRVQWDQVRRELDDPVVAYRRQVNPDEAITLPPQEVFEVFVLPVGVGKGKRVLRQETLP